MQTMDTETKLAPLRRRRQRRTKWSRSELGDGVVLPPPPVTGRQRAGPAMGPATYPWPHTEGFHGSDEPTRGGQILRRMAIVSRRAVEFSAALNRSRPNPLVVGLSHFPCANRLPAVSRRMPVLVLVSVWGHAAYAFPFRWKRGTCRRLTHPPRSRPRRPPPRQLSGLRPVSKPRRRSCFPSRREASSRFASVRMVRRDSHPGRAPSRWHVEFAVAHQPGRAKPAHPDLYSSDIPVALARLRVRFTFYSARRGGFDAFARWVKEALAAGDPVLAGVKILPTKHPEWGLESLRTGRGHGPKGLLVNTTWGIRHGSATRRPRGSPSGTWHTVSACADSLVARTRRPLGLRSWRREPGALDCASLARPHERSLLSRAADALASDRQPLWSATAIALGAGSEHELSVEADGTSRFYCVPLSGQPEATLGGPACARAAIIGLSARAFPSIQAAPAKLGRKRRGFCR